MDGKQYSLRAHLLGLISIPIIIAGIVISSFALFSIYHEIEEVSDAHLTHYTTVLLQLTKFGISDYDLHEEVSDVKDSNKPYGYERKLTFRIWKDDRLLTESRSAKILGPLIAPVGFSERYIEGKHWRFLVLVDQATGITVEVAEKYEIRTELIIRILSSLLIPGIIFVPIILLLVWYGTTKSLQPLLNFSQMVDRRDVNDLSPIQATRMQKEISPLYMALNGLLQRVSESLQREREFTDNAAHELRTPLAAMKTQTQVLLKQAQDLPEYKEGLNNLHASINRATRMVNQLLSFARVQSQDLDFKDVNLSNMLSTVLCEVGPLSIEKDIELKTDISSDMIVQGNENALSVVARNLIHNAIKFTPKNGEILISLTQKENHPVLIVRDNGQGIAGEHKNRVFERFYRADKGKSDGSGLGLAMVKWICDAHNAEIVLEDNEPSGLIVTVMFDGVLAKKS